jgi:hypothetical protein
MEPLNDGITLSEVLRFLLIVSGISLVLAAIVGVWVWNRVKRLRLPADATFVEAMRLTPFSVVLFLDLLDLGLDIFAAPVAWVVLSRLGLRQLRGASVIEALVPGTQMLPTMTTAWLLVRLFGPHLDEIPWMRDAVNQQTVKRLQDIPKGYRR